jgi:hypothetical protein
MQLPGVGINALRAKVDGEVAEQVSDNEAKQDNTRGGHKQFAPYGTANNMFQRHGTNIL